MKIGFGTVVYNEAFEYYKEYVDSLNDQDFNDFDVILLNDNLSTKQCNALCDSINRETILIELEESFSISQLRIQLLKVAKEKGYELLILGDFDDTCSANRISTIVNAFDTDIYFFYNDLKYLKTGRNFFSYLPKSLESADVIMEKNFLGLGNTALNLNKIDTEIFKQIEHKKTRIFDWMLYTVLLLNGGKGLKVDGCFSNYRIHEQNIAGDFENSAETLKREIEIKIEHYKQLLEYDKYKILYRRYNELINDFESKKTELLSSVINDEHYWWGQLKIKNIRSR